MKILDRYIARSVYGGTALAMLVLLSIFSFFILVDHLADVGKGEYGVLNAIEYVILTLPRRAYEFFPMAALIGSIVGLGVLSASSELTIIRSAGISVWRIVYSVMKSAAVLMFIAVILGEAISPYSELLAQTRRLQALSTAGYQFGNNMWARDGNSFINIREPREDNLMSDIYIYEFDENHKLHVATHAKEGRYEKDRWLLTGIEQSNLQDDGIEHHRIDKAEWASEFGPELINVAVDEPQRLSVLGLYRYIAYLQRNGQDSSPYELGLWSKFIAPVSTAVMIFLAVPFVFGSLRNAGAGQRILVGVMVGIAFHMANQTFIEMGLVYGLSPFVSAVFPTMAFFAIGLFMYSRIH